jgi:hypothetical protein
MEFVLLEQRKGLGHQREAVDEALRRPPAGPRVNAGGRGRRQGRARWRRRTGSSLARPTESSAASAPFLSPAARSSRALRRACRVGARAVWPRPGAAPRPAAAGMAHAQRGARTRSTQAKSLGAGSAKGSSRSSLLIMDMGSGRLLATPLVPPTAAASSRSAM